MGAQLILGAQQTLLVLGAQEDHMVEGANGSPGSLWSQSDEMKKGVGKGHFGRASCDDSIREDINEKKKRFLSGIARIT